VAKSCHGASFVKREAYLVKSDASESNDEIRDTSDDGSDTNSSFAHGVWSMNHPYPAVAVSSVIVVPRVRAK
jgi:hypothetical protein